MFSSSNVFRRGFRLFLIGVFLAMAMALAPHPAKAQGKPAKVSVDLNSSSEAELETLPGVGSVTAKKIVAGRPYRSVDELSRIGLSPKAIDGLKPMVKVSSASAPRAVAPSSRGAASAKVDLNSASDAELEALPGVGPVAAKKIVAARPYRSVDDLSRAGLSAKTIDGLKPLVNATPSSASIPATTRPKSPPVAVGAPATSAGASQGRNSTTGVGQQSRSTADRATANHRINLNTATQEELESLPGIGPVKAKLIIDGRPYSTPEDVMKVKGIKEGEFGKIKDLISVR